MWEPTLSYVVLEFFTWNPRWDDYLNKMTEERIKKQEEKELCQRCTQDKN